LLAALLTLLNKLPGLSNPLTVVLLCFEQAADTVKDQGSIQQAEQTACLQTLDQQFCALAMSAFVTAGLLSTAAHKSLGRKSSQCKLLGFYAVSLLCL